MLTALSNRENFQIKSFVPKHDYEFNKITASINDGKIYVKGTEETINSLKLLSKVRYINYEAAGLGFALSFKEYTENKISGSILALDGGMGIASFTGAGTPIAAVYFVLIDLIQKISILFINQKTFIAYHVCK